VLALRLFVFVLIVFSHVAGAAPLSCNVAKALSSPKIANKAEFWREFGNLMALKESNEAKVLDLLAKYGVEVSAQSGVTIPAASDSASISPLSPYTVTPEATKDIEKLPTHLRERFDVFLQVMAQGKGGMGTFREQSERWNLEKLNFDSTTHTVRLNAAYRVSFRTLPDGTYEILDVTNAITH
jgi:hypothetical protein